MIPVPTGAQGTSTNALLTHYGLSAQDEPLLRDAARRKLAKYDQPNDAQAIDAELARAAGGDEARLSLAPFVLLVTMEAIGEYDRTPAQEEFYRQFQHYYGYQQQFVAQRTLKAWNEYVGRPAAVPIGTPEAPSGVHTLSILFDTGPSVTGFQPPRNALGVGEAGVEAVAELYVPMMAADLPEFQDNPALSIGQDMNAILAGVGFGVGGSAAVFASMAAIPAASAAAQIAATSGIALTTTVAAGATTSTVTTTSVGTTAITAAGTAGSLAASAVVVLPILLAGGMKIADFVKTQEFEAALEKAAATPVLDEDLRRLVNPRIVQDDGLYYSACRDGYRGVATRCYRDCPAGYADDGLTCRRDPHTITKATYARATLPLQCAPGLVQDAGACYPPCNGGWRGVASICYQDCPGGFRDDGLYCGKPVAYSREGFPWSPGDPPLPNYSGPTSRCEGKYGQGQCEQWGALIYPKCQQSFHAVGCCVCSPNCPTGWEDIGVSCKKPSYGRGVGQPLNTCPPGQEQQGALCYPICREGFNGQLDRCVASACPEGYRNDPLTCFRGAEVHGKEFYDRGVGSAHPPPVDAQRASIFTYLVKMVVSDPADRAAGTIGLQVPAVGSFTGPPVEAIIVRSIPLDIQDATTPTSMTSAPVGTESPLPPAGESFEEMVARMQEAAGRTVQRYTAIDPLFQRYDASASFDPAPEDISEETIGKLRELDVRHGNALESYKRDLFRKIRKTAAKVQAISATHGNPKRVEKQRARFKQQVARAYTTFESGVAKTNKLFDEFRDEILSNAAER